MKPSIFIFKRTVLCIAILTTFYLPAHAEKADKEQPIILEAEKVSVDDVQQIYELSKDILLIKGSIVITGDEGKIKIDPQGYEHVQMDGTSTKAATFRERREGPSDEYMQGIGKNVVYDAKSELVTLTDNAILKRLHNMQLVDELRGWKIEYEDIKQHYRVSPPNTPTLDGLPLARSILSPRSKVTFDK